MGREIIRTDTGTVEKIANYGEVKLDDGSLNVKLGGIYGDLVDTYSNTGDYIYNPNTGEGHTTGEWYAIVESLKPTDKGTEGEVRYLGLGDWCKYEYDSICGWICSADTASGLIEIFEAYR